MQNEITKKVRRVKEKYELELLNRPGVVGVGVGLRQRAGQFTDEVCIVVSVREKYPPETLDSLEMLPTILDGVPVDVQAVGEIRAGGPQGGQN